MSNLNTMVCANVMAAGSFGVFMLGTTVYGYFMKKPCNNNWLILSCLSGTSLISAALMLHQGLKHRGLALAAFTNMILSSTTGYEMNKAGMNSFMTSVFSVAAVIGIFNLATLGISMNQHDRNKRIHS